VVSAWMFVRIVYVLYIQSFDTGVLLVDAFAFDVQ
jgi:hypothetical protein